MVVSHLNGEHVVFVLSIGANARAVTVLAHSEIMRIPARRPADSEANKDSFRVDEQPGITRQLTDPPKPICLIKIRQLEINRAPTPNFAVDNQISAPQ